jgi:hypothetical protein
VDSHWWFPLSYVGGDFGIVGSSYRATDPQQDVQASINYFVEVSQDAKSKTPTALLGAPGYKNLIDVATEDSGGEVRGCWVLPGGQSAIVVCGNSISRVTVTVPATQTSIAQFSVTEIYSSMLTNSGQVCIRDNGEGGYAIIVDGPAGYLVDLSTNATSQITDPAFYGSDRVAFIDGWLIFNKPGTQTFYTTGPTPYTVTFPGAFFALKDSSSDNLVTLMENNRELWLIGERASEVWYNAGGANFAFSRIQGVSPQIGCAAKHSIARLGSALVWLGKSERGENIVIRTEQYGFTSISTRAVEYEISTYPLVSDAFGYTYEEGGHLFYVLQFPTADKTWVFDTTTEQWHERASFDDTSGLFHRNRSNCFMNFQNLRIVGDNQNGFLQQMSREFFDDAGEPLVALRRAPHLWSRENRKRLFHAKVQIEFRPGVGLQVGQGSNPQAMLRWSNDGGETYGNEHWTTIGAAGRYKNRAIWRRLGSARDRVYEVRVSDPVCRDIVGATLFAQSEVEAA